MDEQRRVPRHRTDRAARYRLDAEAEAEWRDCQVIDVSSDGAALELYGIVDDEPLQGVFHLEITSVSDGDDPVPVAGVLRHGRRTALGRVLVGIEFQGLTAEQLRLLELLVSLRASV
ncbi:MAG: hypothetical protein QOF40_600 [Actinomycetota bacterium]|jgi:hypothetical protein|nr:hypothetical protein [Actinomycetota bacterium]